MSVAKPLKWTDTQDIAMALAEAHGEVDVQHVRFTIQMAWLDEIA